MYNIYIYIHVHNAIYYLIVDLTQRIEHMHYSTGNTYLVAEVMYFSLTSVVLALSASTIDCHQIFLFSLFL